MTTPDLSKFSTDQLRAWAAETKDLATLLSGIEALSYVRQRAELIMNTPLVTELIPHLQTNNPDAIAYLPRNPHLGTAQADDLTRWALARLAHDSDASMLGAARDFLVEFDHHARPLAAATVDALLDMLRDVSPHDYEPYRGLSLRQRPLTQQHAVLSTLSMLRASIEPAQMARLLRIARQDPEWVEALVEHDAATQPVLRDFVLQPDRDLAIDETLVRDERLNGDPVLRAFWAQHPSPTVRAWLSVTGSPDEFRRTVTALMRTDPGAAIDLIDAAVDENVATLSLTDLVPAMRSPDGQVRIRAIALTRSGRPFQAVAAPPSRTL